MLYVNKYFDLIYVFSLSWVTLYIQLLIFSSDLKSIYPFSYMNDIGL